MDDSSTPLLLIKYGGNAMRDPKLSSRIIAALAELIRQNCRIVLVHGGGPFIESTLQDYAIASEFVGGHRKTSPEALPFVEMALRGNVNARLVGLFNKEGIRAVGLSGKDGRMVIAEKRYHLEQVNGKPVKKDLGRVGAVKEVDPELLQLLLKNGYTPVVTCIACDEEGLEYNVNADILAGHLAGALKADQYIVLTDVDGLRTDPDDADTLLSETTLRELGTTYKSSIRGGMIPKIESCRIALQKGAKSACILNGTKPESLRSTLLGDVVSGTRILK